MTQIFLNFIFFKIGTTWCIFAKKQSENKTIFINLLRLMIGHLFYSFCLLQNICTMNFEPVRFTITKYVLIYISWDRLINVIWFIKVARKHKWLFINYIKKNQKQYIQHSIFLADSRFIPDPAHFFAEFAPCIKIFVIK